MNFTQRMSLAVGATALSVLPLSIETALADSDTTMTVSASVADACTLGTVGDLAFGEYVPGQGTTKESSVIFNIQCTAGSSATLAVDGGNNPGTKRQMANGGSDLLAYDLFYNGLAVGDGAGNSFPASPAALTLLSGANPITLNGIVPAGQEPLGGEYSDTVTISLIF